MRRTKIVATIGPKTESYEMLRLLAESGVNVFRLNFSHGTHEWHGNVMDRISRLNQETGRHCAVMLDTKGPEIRTGDLRVPIELRKGQEIILTVEHGRSEELEKITVNYDAFIHDVEEGDRVLVDNGLMTLQVKKIQGKNVVCEVLDGGTLGSRRHLNLPGKDVSLDSLTEKDWNDIRFGIEKKVDFLALSFVRGPREIETVKKFLRKEKADISVIAKIETLDATKHLAGIFEASDGIMVARGDLGAEVPFTQVPLLQWEMAQMAGRYQKFSIVATQMLESMSRSPIPTRAEVSDVFAAVWQRNDAIMLSGETAMGEFPLKAVQAMHDIAIETETNYLRKRAIRKVEPTDERSEFCKNAGTAAEDLDDIAGIVVVTKTGYMANLMAAFRPRSPIFAVTNQASTARQCEILWGTESFLVHFSEDPEKTIEQAVKVILGKKPELKKKKYVLLSDILVGEALMPAVQIRTF
ncbi:pyruvate kinase [Candidatus Gracilibacteria bacterium]|nr:pyruvate kinase [Candidatus Gracilibacteria bacterium]MCF7819546.1 pyruvate kinase [Candidatus Gracilibacteria bacterium]